MKIAIASEGKEKSSEISSKGGRAPYYLIFEQGKLLEVLKNPFATGSGGAGFSVSYLMKEKEVDLVIAGRFGKNMEDTLKEKGIQFKEESGKVFDFIQG